MNDDTPTILPPRSQVFAHVFDRLIDSNLQLTTSVGKLVKLTYGVLAFNFILVLILVAERWAR